MHPLTLRLLIGALALFPAALAATAAPVTTGDYELGDFSLEGGQVLPNAKLRFATAGALNAAGDNAVLVPSWYSGTLENNTYLVDGETGLDPARYFVVFTEMFGSSHSSSPSNTPPPFDGPRFPAVTIRDNVRASHQLLTSHLGVKKLRAVIGFSMGAQQAFQWAVSYPRMVENIVPICGTAKTYPHGRIRLESAVSCFQADPNWNGGDFRVPLDKGIDAWAKHWAAWVFSQEWWRLELYKKQGHRVPADVVRNFRRGLGALNANDLVLQARTWQQHDIGTTPGFEGNVEQALAAIEARVLYLPGETDLYFPMTDARYEAPFIRHLTFKPIPSLWGHAAGSADDPQDRAFLLRSIRGFLDPAP